MTFPDTLGIIGSVLFFIKICLHIYIKRSLDTKYSISTLGQYTDPILFLPILETVQDKLKIVKIIGNMLYVAAIVLIIIFLVLIK